MKFVRVHLLIGWFLLQNNCPHQIVVIIYLIIFELLCKKKLIKTELRIIYLPPNFNCKFHWYILVLFIFSIYILIKHNISKTPKKKHPHKQLKLISYFYHSLTARTTSKSLLGRSKHLYTPLPNHKFHSTKKPKERESRKKTWKKEESWKTHWGTPKGVLWKKKV